MELQRGGDQQMGRLPWLRFLLEMMVMTPATAPTPCRRYSSSDRLLTTMETAPRQEEVTLIFSLMASTQGKNRSLLEQCSMLMSLEPLAGVSAGAPISEMAAKLVKRRTTVTRLSTTLATQLQPASSMGRQLIPLL